MLRVLDPTISRLVQSAFHGVEGIALAGQDRVLEQAVQLLRKCTLQAPEVEDPAGPGDLSQGHLVLG